MINNFRNNIQEAIHHHKQTKLPNISLIIISALACVLAYIIVATFNGETPDAHFSYESGAITALSAILLTTASALSLAVLVVNVRFNNPDIVLWVLMALGFGFLALDELIGFHEQLGIIIGYYAYSGVFRNWNDVIVILYGVIALPFIVVFLSRIMRYRMLLELFIVAFIFYILHTLIDSLSEPSTTLSAILEESSKLICVLFLALSVFIAFIGTVWNVEMATTTNSD